MLAIDRIKAIMDLLQENKSAMVSELSQLLGVTEETIRRDLEKLEAKKRIVRVHGGAYLLEGFEKGAPVSLLKKFMVDEKERLGKTCLDFIEDKDTIMLDNSTTSYFLAKEIKTSSLELTVITNFLDIIIELSDCKHVKLISLGGTLKLSSNTFVGPMAINNSMKYFADKSFVSCSAINSHFGISSHNEEDAQIRKNMITNSETKFLVIDHTKTNKSATHVFANISDIDYIIIDKVSSKTWENSVIELGAKLIVS